MTELWLARHGQTDWNLIGRYQGQADTALNDTGIAQAYELADSLAGKPFAAIISSDLIRARQTAEIIAARLNLPIQVDARLREIHQGEWQGMLYAEVVEQYGGISSTSASEPDTWRAPQGESVQEVASRAASAANDIARSYPDERVLVVAHGLCLATLICQANQIPLAEVYEHIPANAVIQVLTWEA